MSVSIKFNKQGMEKIRKQMEKELNRQIQIGVSDLRKDSEKFLEIVLKKREEIGEDALSFGLEDFSAIPNIQMNIKTILDDLKIHGCISDNSSMFISGEMDIYLTMEGIEYFKDKERVNQVGQIKARNPYYGWVPVVLSSEIEKVLSNVPAKEAISGLIDLYESDNEFLAFNMNSDCNQSLSELVDFDTVFCVQFGKNQIYRIISTIQNKILDWALLLEENGII